MREATGHVSASSSSAFSETSISRSIMRAAERSPCSPNRSRIVTTISATTGSTGSSGSGRSARVGASDTPASPIGRFAFFAKPTLVHGVPPRTLAGQVRPAAYDALAMVAIHETPVERLGDPDAAVRRLQEQGIRSAEPLGLATTRDGLGLASDTTAWEVLGDPAAI